MTSGIIKFICEKYNAKEIFMSDVDVDNFIEDNNADMRRFFNVGGGYVSNAEGMSVNFDYSDAIKFFAKQFRVKLTILMHYSDADTKPRFAYENGSGSMILAIFPTHL